MTKFSNFFFLFLFDSIFTAMGIDCAEQIEVEYFISDPIGFPRTFISTPAH